VADIRNEYAARALPWDLILTSGMARDHMELADNYEFGSRANRFNPVRFRRQTGEFRTYAGTLALQCAHAFEMFDQTNEDRCRNGSFWWAGAQL
jgi:hypothetical protein